MLQVTADLYSVYMVLFLHTNKEEDYVNYVPEYAVRGEYRDRHCVVRLNSNLIYEAMIGRDYVVGDRVLGMVNWESSPLDGVGAEKGDEWHPWRCDFEDLEARGRLKAKPAVKVGRKELERVIGVSLRPRRWKRVKYKAILSGNTAGAENTAAIPFVDDPDQIWKGSRFSTKIEPDSEQDSEQDSEPDDEPIFTGVNPVAVPTDHRAERTCKRKRGAKERINSNERKFSIDVIVRISSFLKFLIRIKY